MSAPPEIRADLADAATPTTRRGHVCRTCLIPKPWAEFGYRTGPGKGRRSQCKACDKTNPVPGTFDEYAADLYPSPDTTLHDSEEMRAAFEAGCRAAALGYVPRTAPSKENAA
jgi:hypothetical protein